MRVPVDQPLAAVDQPVLEQAEERVADGPGTDRVEREPGPLPVAAAAHLLELAEDPGFVLAPSTPRSARPAPRGPGRAGSSFSSVKQPPLDDRLGGDAGVVGARHPERVEALHPLLADEDVLQRVVQGMAQVQGAGDVGRRDDDRVRLAVRVRARCGSSPALPRSGYQRSWAAA